MRIYSFGRRASSSRRIIRVYNTQIRVYAVLEGELHHLDVGPLQGRRRLRGHGHTGLGFSVCRLGFRV